MTLLPASAAAIVGALAGSYIATLVLRWERGEGASTGRSRCDHCGATLGPAELVPLLSRIGLRGKCRHCGGAIDPFHAGVEAAAAAIGFAALALLPPAEGAAVALFGWLMLPSLLLDWRHQWLPDRLTLLLAFAGLPGGHVLGVAALDQLAGGVAGYGSLALVARAYTAARGRDGLGRGDPKLFGAIGLWTGWQWLAPILLLASVLGLAIALLRHLDRTARLPFGTLLGAAAWLLLVGGKVLAP